MIHLTAADLMFASALVFLQAGASWLLRLNLHRQVLWSAVRMVMQLLLVGWVLRFVFEASSPLVTLLVIVVMVAAVAREVASRPKQRLIRGFL